jgi:hypothetical protein
MTAGAQLQAALAKAGLYTGAIDGDFGSKSRAALGALNGFPLPPFEFEVIASEFAMEADLVAYNSAIARGATHEQAFAVGDNCVGCWGDPTGPGTAPQCAVPPEVMTAFWGSEEAAKHQRILVLYNGRNCVVTLGDVMPHLWDITNGAGIDLNEVACDALGLPYDAMVPVQWGLVKQA